MCWPARGVGLWDGERAGYKCCYTHGNCGTTRCRIGLIFWIQPVVFGNRNDNCEPAALASPCHGQNHVQYGATICCEEAHQSVSSDESSRLRNEYRTSYTGQEPHRRTDIVGPAEEEQKTQRFYRESSCAGANSKTNREAYAPIQRGYLL